MALFGEIEYALIAAPKTSIGGIIPDVVVEEVSRDDLIITDHPVERGAAITDHAFLRPASIEMRIGFSNSTAGSEGYIDAVYADLLQLQGIREPFDVFTPRRRYPNMLIAGISLTRDERTNSILALTIACRQIIIAYTQQASGNGDAAAAPGQSNQAAPEATASPSDLGSQQTIDEQSFAGAYNSGVGVGGNAMFLNPEGVDSLGGTGGLAGFDEITFTDPAAPLFSETIPDIGVIAGPEAAINNLTGSVGQFGRYAPGAFGA